MKAYKNIHFEQLGGNMYPKQTQLNNMLFSQLNPDAVPSSENSHLHLSHKPNTDLVIYDISMPYLILYQALYPTLNRSIYFEFSEQHKKQFISTYEATTQTEMPMHSHDFYELTIVLSGECKMKIENEIVSFKAGDCWFGNKNIHHKEFMDCELEIVQFLFKEEYIIEIFDNNLAYNEENNPSSLSSFFSKLFHRNNKNPFYNSKEYVDIRIKDFQHLTIIHQFINELMTELLFGYHGKSHIMKGLICKLFYFLEDKAVFNIETHLAQLTTEEHILFTIASAYKDKMGLFSRKEIEELTGYNGNYVARIVKKNTGMNLLDYGKIFLLEHARQLLINTNLSVQEIVEKLGYSNRYYFNRIFIERYQVTPSEFRKLNRMKSN